MPPPPPQLMDELVEEILLRLPADSPASLVRAGLVCKSWCHLVSTPGFQRRFREHHRSPPILGFLDTCTIDDGSDDDDDDGYTYTKSTSTSFVPNPGSGLRGVDHPGLRPRECRHGRVLLYSNEHYDTPTIVVWDPITGERVQLPNPPPPLLFDPVTGEQVHQLPEPDSPPPVFFANTWTAAVLCADAATTPSGTCDHLDCHGGPFVVVLVVQCTDDLPISSYVYSSESGAWSEPTFSPYSGGWWCRWLNGALLVADALYFLPQLITTNSILQYDLGTRKITAIDLPEAARMDRSIPALIELMATMDGRRLGFAAVEDKTKLCLWSREEVGVGGGGWALCQVIDLDKLLPMDSLRDYSTPYLLYGSAEGTGVVFMRVGWRPCRLVAIDLWSSGLVTEVDERKPSYYAIAKVVPYMSFFTPVLSLSRSRSPCTDDGGPRASASKCLRGLPGKKT